MNVNDLNTPPGTTPNVSIVSDPSIPNPAGFNGHNELSSAQVSQLVEWAKEDLASGKITQAQADAQFAELNVPIDQRGWQPDQRSAEQQQLDAAFPAAKPTDYVIQYDRPGQERPMDAIQKQNLQKFDTTARTWLSTAGFSRDHGNALATAIGRVVEATNGMSESQLEAYGEREYEKLSQAYGPELDAKLQLASKMIHELDAKQPGLKRLLQTRGIGDSAPVVALLVQQAERYRVRNRR
jgi:hypothetical protein